MIYSTGSNSNNNIINCTFINNTASNGVGAIYTRNANIIGCIFENNTATNDWPAIYFEGNGKGNISYNVFLDNAVQIRLRNSVSNVVEEYNWWATNEPNNMVRLENTLSTPKKYIVLEAYNDGETIYAGFIRDCENNNIPDINALPIRIITFEGDVNETVLELSNGLATVMYTSEITDTSNINATVDNYTINYNIASGNIVSINVIFVQNTTVGNDGNIVIYVVGSNGPVNGTLAIYLNDTKFEVDVLDNVAVLTKGSTLDGGIYDIYYEYLGSSYYAPTLNKTKSDSKFEIEKNDVNITYSIDKDGWITIKVTDEINPTGSVKMVIDDSITRNYGTSVRTNLPENLAEGTHTINLTYGGDSKHNPKTLSDTFEVIKMIPPCNITQDGGKFTFDFTTALAYKGSVTVDFVGPNSFSENLYNLPNTGIVSVDVTKKLQNGSYNLTVHFSSYSYGYASADFNYSFDVLKHKIISMTVSPEVPTKTFYTTIPVTVTITVEDGLPMPTGKVIIPTGGQASTGNLNENGVATIVWANRADKMGSELKNVTYEGDINYDSYSVEVTFICTPTPLDIGLTANGNNVTLTFNDKNGHDNNGIVHIYDYDEYLGNVTGNDGFPEFKVNDLDSGIHYFNVVWQNNNGINYTSSKSFVLNRVPGTSQWPNTGFDIKNSGNSNYTRPIDDVYIIWSNDKSINITKYPNNIRREWSGETSYIYGGVTSYSPIIGSDGVIFLNDGYTIYVYDSEGNVLYTRSPGRIVPGITIYNDTIILATRTDEELIAYDFFNAKGYGTETNWVSSAYYYPIVGPDGRIYISSQWDNMANNGKWVTVLKYGLWGGDSFSWDAAYIGSKPIATPVFDDEGNMWVATVSGLRAVNIYSESNIFSDNIGINARPVISEANIVYYLGTDNTLYALTGEGYLWNTTFNGTVGSALAIDNENGFVYTVNKEGILYKFDTNENGALSEVYNLGANARSIIVDGNSNVYVGDENGAVTAFDSEGTLLWSINLGSSIAGGLAMNKDGIIYAYTNDTLFALGYRAPISIEVTVPEGEYTALDNVTITATLNETTEGNVTFTINGKNTTVAINGTVAELTTTIPGGIQTIVATFEGNDAYMPVAGNATVDIAKVDVEFENVPDEVVIEYGSRYIFYYNIISNGVNVITGTTKGIDENGNEYTSSWRYYNNLGWQARITNIAAGNHTITIVYSGDDTYNAANKTFNLVVLPKVTPTVTVVDDANEITVDVTVSADDATGKFTVIANNETLGEGTIENGVGSVTFDKLEPGTYEFTIVYEGDDNYPANNATVSVKIPRTSQWPSVGGNPQNSGAADATREDGVSIIWEAALNGDLRSSAIIDGLGNIYVNDGSKIYAFTSEGKLIWSGGIGSAGIALYKDELILAPQYHNAMMIYNATTGAAIPGNFWSASSNFAPITGPDGRIYTPTDYGYPADGQGWSGNYWISVFDETGNEWEPYGFNLFLVEVTGVGYGSQAMKASPSFDKLGYIYANTVKGFKIVNIATGATVFSDTNINGVGRPVIDENNIAYILDSTLNGIYAISAEGIIWNVTVTDGIGSTLAVDNENGFLYAVNANGALYKYDTADGSESLVYDLGAAGVSIILDADSNVYVSTAAGDVVAISADGDLLWTINLGSKVTGQLAMDNNGIIYAVADKKLYALGFDANMTVSGENVTVFDDEIITVTIAAEGNVTITFNGESTEVPIENGTATLNVGKLAAGDYTVSVTYGGDGVTYGPAFAEATFEIIKADAEITEDVVASVENSTLTVTLPENATGIILAKVDGKGYYAEVENGTAVIEIPELAPGKYPVDISYLGDDNYNNVSFTTELEVPALLDPELDVSVEDTVITVTINENATGKVIVTVGNNSYVKDAGEAPIVIDVADLEAGEYDVTVEYLGDESFLADTANGSVTVPEEPVVEPKDPELKATAENTTVTVNVNKDATGGVIVDVDGTSYYAEIKDGQAIIDVKGLEAGKDYTATVIYTGDDNFTEDETTVKISVPKEEEIEPEDASMTVDSSNSTITIELPEDATGYVLVDIDGKGYYAKVTDGKATVDVAGLDAGNYTATVTYTGDDNYKANTSSVAVSIPEEDEPIPEPVTPEMTVKVTNTTIEVTLPKDATGNVLVDVNGQGYYAPVKDGKATVNVIGLDEGNYSATVTYAGDDKYTNASKPASVTVPKDEEPTPEPVNPKADINVSDDAVNVELPKDATGYMLVDVDGKGYYAPVKDGKASIDLPELAPGNHTVTVTYTGDDKYKPATANKTVTVEKEIITVVSENLTKIEKAPDRFEAVFTDSDGNALANKNVTFGLNGITYTRTTDANGKAGMNINLVPGTYSIKTTNPVTNESATNTITVLPRFTEDSDLVKYFRNDSQYVLKVLDDNGNPAKAGEIVTYNINGVFYNRTTNATGHVKLNINLPPDTYIITAEYKGCKVAHTVKVLPTLTGSDITKKYGQAGAYEAKLVDGQGKAYANQKIEFNINGVMYQRTTNADGVAKLNINLQAGKYIITASYGQARISNTVTVTA